MMSGTHTQKKLPTKLQRKSIVEIFCRVGIYRLLKNRYMTDEEWARHTNDALPLSGAVDDLPLAGYVDALPLEGAALPLAGGI